LARRDVSLATLKGGAAVALFNKELKKVLNNIADPNTEPKKARKIVLTVTIIPNEERAMGGIAIEIDSKLVKPKPETSYIFMGSDGETVRATEDYAEQQSLEFEEQDRYIKQFQKEA